MALASTSASPSRNSASVVAGAPERHLDDVRLLEVERLAELDARHDRQAEQVIVDDRHQLLAQLLERRELERD